LLDRPLTLPCGATLPNRIGKSAMTEGLCDASGRPNQRHERLYRRWSAGGAGLLITGNVMVDWRYLEPATNCGYRSATREDSARACPADALSPRPPCS
jgi:2,4-dienoyl-CoA reductase-like NADH-dependent reductase (Old Yellow Enzyme family)